MLHPPVRNNLVAQVVEAIRAEISNHSFKSNLPGELFLCQLLQVSRPTLRAALSILEQQGYIQTQKGKPRSIVSKRRRKQENCTTRHVALLSGLAMTYLPRHSLILCTQIFNRLQRQGHPCEFHSNKTFSSRASGGTLRKLVESCPNSVWLLNSCSEETQQWFYKAGLPTLILGHRHKNISLPSVDINLFSVGQHAAHYFLNKAHRNLAVIIPDPSAAGDLSLESGFFETARKSKAPGISVLRIKTRYESDSIRKTVSRLLMSSPRPTAICVSNEEIILPLFTLLLQKNFQVPRDFSVIVGDSGRMLQYFRPDFARYEVDLDTEVTKTSRLVTELATNGALRPTEHLILPKFHSGETIIALP